ncbi:WD40 repeat-like protein [Schizopora paradoxa]|uniref:WD40 repeat-like protein n=1 Tax=Schizopora paradoxa TaxID=27342 RepID=A0A0H2RLU7_9AGAM|nr:WD40 repeat-like protein [Schizopora paradoxa]
MVAINPFTPGVLRPCNPSTERGSSTKLSTSKDKLIYCNGRAVIIRDLKDPANAKCYSGHSKPVSVARFSPTGYYCASADIYGTVRVWDTVGEENIMKSEFPVISGKVNDLAWDGESKRIIAVGDGKQQFAKAFMFDTGTTNGVISGHSKSINAVSIRHQRPFRAVTASDDFTIVFHSGVPFKFEKLIKTHTKFVQDVQYSPNGDHFVSVGSDSKVFLYDGKTGETIGEFSSTGAHKGSIMACSWSSDNKTISTSSMDGTVKLWDVATRENVQTWTVGTGVPNQQVGNAWAEGGDIVSLSLSGVLNVFDQREGGKPSRTLHGPQKAITAATVTSSGTFIAGTGDGRILAYDNEGNTSLTEGESHKNLVTGFAVQGDTLLSVGMDDTLREVEGNGQRMSAAQSKLDTQPKGIATSSEGTAFIAEVSKIEAFRSNQKIAELSVIYGPSSISTTGQLVAVGGDDQKVHFYNWDGKALKESSTADGFAGAVVSVAFSPNGKTLAVGNSSGRVSLYDVQDKNVVESRWSFQTSRIHSFAWTPDGEHLASASLDTSIYVWCVKKPLEKVAIRNAVPGGVNAVVWLKVDGAAKKGTIAGAGADGCVRTWEVSLP